MQNESQDLSQRVSATYVTFLLNLGCGFVWLFLAQKVSLSSFFTGLLFGYVIIVLFRPVLHAEEYVRRIWGAILFAFVFLREFIVSNLTIAAAVLSFRRSFQPAFLNYPIGHLTDLEVLMLSQCITLTPGTTSTKVTDDGQTLVVHAFDAKDPEAVVSGIRNTLERGILRFSR